MRPESQIQASKFALFFAIGTILCAAAIGGVSYIIAGLRYNSDPGFASKFGAVFGALLGGPLAVHLGLAPHKK